MIGKTLLYYEVTARIGAGGMGEVYCATDTKLDREVAIKILPTEVAKDPERLSSWMPRCLRVTSRPTTEPPRVPSVGGRRTGAWRTAVGHPLQLPFDPAVVFRIRPGFPEESGVYRLMATRAVGLQMPPIATELVDPEGLALVEAWTRALE